MHYLGKRLLDTPNLRSSHQTPTPRGGGIAIVFSTITAAIIAVTSGYLDENIFGWLVIPASLIAFIGICDDFFSLSIKVRLVAQLILASTAIYALNPEQFLQQHTPQEYALLFPMIIFITWMTNLYNFMDGINGLAALESITVCLGMILIYTFQNTHQMSTYLMLVIMASTCGFLFWNFPSAKLFMGDSGSLFLGFSFGLLTLETIHHNNLTASWIIMLAVFIMDASYTLFYRIISGQAFSQAHRSHTYQKCAQIYKSHTHVTLAIVIINSLWLFPLALATAVNILDPFIGILISYTPLLILAKKYNAGRPD